MNSMNHLICLSKIILIRIFISLLNFGNCYIVLLMSSTFKNRVPKRKYRERAQPEAREHLGLL